MEREPYFTSEERKTSWIRDEENYKFVTHQDLSGGVDVYPINEDAGDDSYLAQDIACFIAHFMLWKYPRLNGFSGMDCIQWRINKDPYSK